MAHIFFGAAAGVCALTVFIHVFLGGAKRVRPYLAVEMEPGLKWLGYLMWHLGTVSTLFLMAGYAAAALSGDLHVLDCDRAGGGGVGGLMLPNAFFAGVGLYLPD